ncbi:MAG: four helix bundle protein [Burkholderiales bacterium]|nr:four helix bundle protein [Burkholderiales bacterium]
MTVRAHTKLPVWNASMELVEAFYSVTQSFPKDEIFGLLMFSLFMTPAVQAEPVEALRQAQGERV